VAPAPENPDVAAMMASGKLGSDDAPIKVIEYSSLTCGHCASFHKMELPQIQKAYIDTGKVQFIFKEFPLNEPAVAASQILRCMPMDKYVSFMGLLFDQQEKLGVQAGLHGGADPETPNWQVLRTNKSSPALRTKI
jgi:protein-disulfide isomerase